MIDDKGWLNNFNFIFENTGVSPFFNKRPKDIKISLIVIHCISLPEGDFLNSNVMDLFQNKLDCNKHPSFKSLKDLKVSAHLFIRRNGEIIQFVPFDKCAWHAGESSFNDRDNCNNFSIGIELEGTVQEEFTDKQYEVLNPVILKLKEEYKINHIVGHSDIAPDRKIDPGPHFDWERLND